MSETELPDIVINDIKNGRRYDTAKAKMLCCRTYSEGIGESKLGYNFMSLWREESGGEFFFVQGRSDNKGHVYYRLMTVEEYEKQKDVVYFASAGVDAVGEFVLLCTPEDYRERRADWYAEILGEGTHKLEI